MAEHYSRKLKKIIYKQNMIIELLYNRIFEAKTNVNGGTRGSIYFGNDPMGHSPCEMRRMDNPEDLKKLILSLPGIPASISFHFLGDRFSPEEREEIRKSVEEMSSIH